MQKFKLKIYFLFIFFLVLAGMIGGIGYMAAKFGIDYADSGFFLYRQIRILHGEQNEKGIHLLWYGSDVLGSLWLNFIGSGSLFKAKFGTYIILYFISVFSFFSLVNLTKKIYLSMFACIGAVFFFSISNVVPIINYDIAPLLPLAIIVFLMTLNCVEVRIRFYISISIGFFAVLALFMRISLAPLLLFLSCIYLYKNTFNKRVLIFFLAGIIISITFLLAFPISRRAVDSMFRYVLTSLSLSKSDDSYFSLNSFLSYNIKDQFFFWIKGYIRIIFVGLMIITAGCLYQFYKNKRGIINILLTSILFGVLFFFNTEYPEDKMLLYRYNLLSFKSYLLDYLLYGIIFIGTLFVLIEGNQESRYQLSIFLIIFILFPLGSNSFEKKMSNSFIIIFFPLLYLFFKTIHEKEKNLFFRTKLGFFLNQKAGFKSAMIFIMVLGVIISCSNYFNFRPYRDQVYTKLNTKINNEVLSNVLTNNENARQLNMLDSWFKSKDLSGKSLLCIGRCALINYIFKVNGIFDYPWPEYLSLSSLEKHFVAKKKNNQLPDFVILMDKNSYNTISDPSSLQNINKEHSYFFSFFLKTNQYILVNRSGLFSVFERK